jgi:NADH:ubiquinone oxidoreductase subunit E
MNKVTITVCLGTTCHLLGASHLQNLSQDLSPGMAEKVEIQWKRCLGFCNSNIGKAPYVIINDVVICEATNPRIIEKIELALSNH